MRAAIKNKQKADAKQSELNAAIHIHARHLDIQTFPTGSNAELAPAAFPMCSYREFLGLVEGIALVAA